MDQDRKTVGNSRRPHNRLGKATQLLALVLIPSALVAVGNHVQLEGILYRTNGNISLNTSQAAVPNAATIYSDHLAGVSFVTNGGNFTMAANDKLTIQGDPTTHQGDLVFNAGGGTITVGDLSAMGAITLQGAQIAFCGRPAADLLLADGTVIQDAGVDVVGLGGINIAGAVNMAGVDAESPGAGAFSDWNQRDVSTYRIADPRIQRQPATTGIGLWEKCFTTKDARGGVQMSKHIKAAVADYEKQKGGEEVEDGKALRDFVESDAVTHGEALADLRALQELFRVIGEIGINEREAQYAKERILEDRLLISKRLEDVFEVDVFIDLIESGTIAQPVGDEQAAVE
ncbi:MAG: hypothetical protein HN849_04835 [Victivallales bacterium]|nr:hypothetical protein [Victivallales bacterium]